MVLSKVENHFLLNCACMFQISVITSPWPPQEGEGFWVESCLRFWVYNSTSVFASLSLFERLKWKMKSG